MAKIKNKNRVSSEKIQVNTKQNKKVSNPFEIHINKEKIKVLGRKLKNDSGLPGVARAKALKKRKYTLLQEYKQKNKSNKFTDRRIGEKNVSLSHEDKIMARFTAERVKAHKKKSIFNLGDEVLTHKGQTLSEIEKFVDERSDDEDSLEGDNSGKLEADFVKDAHFGGGVLKRTGKEGARTHKELIEQLISESKKRKAEKQKLKEVTLELTEKLDTEWKDLLPLVNKSKKAADEKESEPQTKVDDYDKVMRELKFEARGNPSDRLKSEDEIAKIEKEKLEQLEKERLERMKGIIGRETKKVPHRSADDLDDDFVYDSDPDLTLSYNDKGESNIKVSAEINGKNVKERNESEKDESDSGEDDSNSSDDEESVDNLSDIKDESDSETNDENAVVPDSSKGDIIAEAVNDKAATQEEIVVDNDDKNSLKDYETANNQNKIRADLLQRKEIMEKARQELPFTFVLPDTYASLCSILENQSPAHQSIIIERMVKCHHPSLGENNKESLGMLFTYLLQHLNDCAVEANDNNTIKSCFQTFACLVPQLFDLAQLNQENAHNSIMEVIKEKHAEYRRKQTVYPGIEVLLFLKLVSCLFPTSDFRHQIVTPCFIFMEQMLNKCKIRSRRDISYGLFLTALVLEV